MDFSTFLPLLPDLRSIAELFPACSLQCGSRQRVFHGVRLYRPGTQPVKGTLYLIQEGDGFPRDDFPWISSHSLSGSADHIVVPGISREELLDQVAGLFSQLQEQEHRLNALLHRNGNLNELCELAAELLGNPVYIHDDWFIVEARSAQVEELFVPEYVMSSEMSFIPKGIIQDFYEDREYLETYSCRGAQQWETHSSKPNCLYVNLWDGTIFRGRLLVMECNRPIRHSDFRLAEVAAQAALQLHRRQLGKQPGKSMDDLILELLQGRIPGTTELSQLIDILKWEENDALLCIRLQSQTPHMPVITQHALHSELFRVFPGSYILLTDQQQCILLNLKRENIPLSHIRYRLAPLCRDYCLYGGISSPISRLRELNIGYRQAEIGLNQAFRLRNEKWIWSFSECALDYLAERIEPPMQLRHLISPDLNKLMELDREKGTAYFETLRMYLLQERDIPRTSEKLIIHRTTLLYRLKKIQSLISANLDDPWQRLYLLFSLRLLEKES